MKDKKQIAETTDEELVELFNQASSTQEKLQYFSRIKDVNRQMELLGSIPCNEKYKFIGKLRTPQSIANVLNSFEDEKTKRKTFNFVAKQFKGNNEGLLSILTQIDFDVTIPPNMLTFKLNNINALNLDFLINIQRHVSNYSKMRFKINEHESDSTDIEYSFSEISAIIAKIEELTADISREMDEANKFYKIYSRITGMMTYDYNCLKQISEARDNFFKNLWNEDAFDQFEAEKKNIRKNPAGLYGGLVEGKAICAGYALILHEASKYVGLNSQYVEGFIPRDYGHAWNQVQIDGKWYNADPTWDSREIQLYGRYEYMLLDDEEFNKTHGKFSLERTETEHKCKSKFDYSKIQGFLLNQIKTAERSGYSL